MARLIDVAQLRGQGPQLSDGVAHAVGFLAEARWLWRAAHRAHLLGVGRAGQGAPGLGARVGAVGWMATGGGPNGGGRRGPFRAPFGTLRTPLGALKGPFRAPFFPPPFGSPPVTIHPTLQHAGGPKKRPLQHAGEGEGGRGGGGDKLGALASYLTSYPSLPSHTMA